MIGPVVNSVAILIGAIIGALFGKRLSKRLRTELTLTFGIASMSVIIIVKMQNLLAVIISLLLGAMIGRASLLK